jgi:hypothetical protein
VQTVLIVAVGFPFPDCPAAGILVGLVEPAIQNAEIQHSVDCRFHPAGAASLLAAPRIVEPHVDALHQFAPDFHVVVFDEDHVFPEFRIARELHHLADV